LIELIESVLNDHIFIIGGQTDGHKQLDNVEEFDDDNECWRVLPNKLTISVSGCGSTCD
jgi:hypothetical protein